MSCGDTGWNKWIDRERTSSDTQNEFATVLKSSEEYQKTNDYSKVIKIKD